MGPKQQVINIKNPHVDSEGKELYEARDRDICIALSAKDHKLVETRIENGRRIRYVFFLADIEEDLALLTSGELMVNAKRYASESAHFKTMMNV